MYHFQIVINVHKNNYDNCDKYCVNQTIKYIKLNKGVNLNKIAGFVMSAYFYPKKYFKYLKEFCNKYNIILAFDEIQFDFVELVNVFISIMI